MFNILNLMATLGLNSSDYEKGLSDAKDSASSFSDKLKTGFSVATKAVTAATAAGTAFGALVVREASNVASYGDNIDKMSQKMGMSAEAYQEWDAIMQHSGTSIESLKASMKTLSNAVETGNDAFERLGITQEEIKGLNSEQLFARTISELQKLENGTEKTYLTGQLLGRGATELGALLNTSAEDTEAMRKRVHELGGVMSNEAVKAAAAYQDNMQDLTTAMSGLKRSITTELLPGFNDIIAGFTSLVIGEEGASDSIRNGVQSIVMQIRENGPKLLSIISGILDAIGGVIIESAPMIMESGTQIIMSLINAVIVNLPQLLSTFVQAISSIGGTIIENVPILLTSIGEALTSIWAFLTENLPVAVENGIAFLQNFAQGMVSDIPNLMLNLGTILQSLFNGFMDYLPTIFDTGSSMITNLTQGLLSNLPAVLEGLGTILISMVTRLLEEAPSFWEKGASFIQQMIDGIVTNLPAIVATVGSLLSKLIATIANNLPNILQKGIEIVKNLAAGILRNLPTLLSSAAQLIAKLLASLINALPKILSAGVRLVGELASGLIKGIPKLLGAVPKLISSIWDGFTNTNWASVGSNIINGIANGVTSMAQNLWNTVQNVAGGILNSIKGFFGIHSPSTVFRDQVGKMLALGMGEGFEDYLPTDDMLGALSGAMDDIANFNMPEIAPNIVNNYNAEGNEGRASGIIINIYGSEYQNPEDIARAVERELTRFENQRAFGIA